MALVYKKFIKETDSGGRQHVMCTTVEHGGEWVHSIGRGIQIVSYNECFKHGTTISTPVQWSAVH